LFFRLDLQMELNLWALILTAVNAVWWLTNLVGLPGNWLMVAGAVLLTLLQRAQPPFSIWTLLAAGLLATAGELVEFFAGYSVARQAGTSRSGARWALWGGLIGGLLGLAIPLPLMGPLLGACIGAAGGAIIAETQQGVAFKPALRRGQAAGVGRLLGTVGKLVIGLAIWLLLAVAAVVR
jgi:uncharacterized protein